jgi:hypothetical protein
VLRVARWELSVSTVLEIFGDAKIKSRNQKLTNHDPGITCDEKIGQLE